jgi:hypothetical protein
MRNFFIAALAVTAACSHSPMTDSSDQLDKPIGKADAASYPSGTFTNASPLIGTLSVLTLNSDFSFSRFAPGLCPGGGTCTPVMTTGTYLFTHSHSSHYIRFYDDSGNALDRYEWTLDAGTLSLARVGGVDGDVWFDMSQQNACESGGGTCVPLVPDACAFGTVADANQFSCGGGLGVECCMPPAHDNSCSQASDCTGLLPQFCRQCGPDGTVTACAHWDCVNNACAIVSCPQ